MQKLVTIPNFLSFFRLLLIPLLVFLVLNINNRLFLLMICIYFFALILDFLDGFLARKLSQESEIGKILDPVADKMMVLALLVALVFKTNFPFWLAVLIIFRDFVILIASIFLMKNRGVLKPSSPVGKITFAIIGLTILVYIIALNDYFSLSLVKNFLSVLCFTFTIWSGLEYLSVFVNEKRNQA